MTFELTNLVPSIPDDRDYRYPVPDEWPTQRSVDLRPLAGSRQNQFRGYCTAAATRNACDLLNARAAIIDPLSEAFLYYNTRSIENRIGQEGAQTRNALRSALHHGICDESTWPTVPGNIDVEPPESAKAEGLTQRVIRYECIYHYSWGPLREQGFRLIRGMKWALAEGLPVVYAFRVGEKFMSLSGPLEQQRYEPIGSLNPHIGNHAICIEGCTDAEPYGSILENSWGLGWGDNGFGLLPDGVVLFDTIEAWAIRGFAGSRIRPAAGIVLRECTRYRLDVRIAVDQPITTNVWVGSRLNGAWLLKTPRGWTPFDPLSDAPEPYLRDVRIEDEIDVAVIDGTDLRPYAGAEVHVAYGQDPMSWTRVKVVTVPKL